ncbi:MAG: hypothetical protein AAFV37_08710 [Pseudomonadota bacterium]
MRAAISLGAMIMGSGAAMAAPDHAFPIGQGSELFWVSAYDGGSDRFYESIVAEQADVQIYKTQGEYAAGDVGDYFALFSGIYVAGCDGDMPTQDERSAIADLWPLTPGSVVEISSGDGAKLEVGEPTEFFLMGQSRPAHIITGTYYGEDTSTEEIIVLDDVKATVGIRWQESGQDSVVLVTRPDDPASTFADTDLIGTCADLLNTETQ